MRFKFKEVHFPYYPNGAGELSVVVADSSFNIGMAFQSSYDPPLPVSIKASCTSDLVVKSLNFKGGFTSQILESLRKVFRYTLNKYLPSLVCKGVTQGIELNLVGKIKEFDTNIDPFIKTPVPGPSRTYPANIELVNWRKSPILAIANFVTHNPDTISYAVHALVNDQSVLPWINPDPDASLFTIPVEGFGNLSIGVGSANFSGLDTFQSFEAGIPTNDYALRSLLSLSKLHMLFDFWVGVNLQGSHTSAPYLKERGLMYVDLKNVSIQAAAAFAVLEKMLPIIHVSQLTNPNCIMDMIYDVNISNLQLTSNIEGFGLDAHTASLEQDLDELITAMLKLVMTDEGYGKSSTAALNGFLFGPGREKINEQIQDMLHQRDVKGGCPTAKILPERILNWDEENVLKLVDKIINNIDNVTHELTINQLIESVVPKLEFPGVLVNMTQTYEDKATAHVVVQNLTISDYASFKHFHVLQAVNNRELNSSKYPPPPSLSLRRKLIQSRSITFLHIQTHTPLQHIFVIVPFFVVIIGFTLGSVNVTAYVELDVRWGDTVFGPINGWTTFLMNNLTIDLGVHAGTCAMTDLLIARLYWYGLLRFAPEDSQTRSHLTQPPSLPRMPTPGSVES